MVFAAGGFSLARLSVEGGGFDDDVWLKGFTVGAGVEAKFSENWSGRLEYMFIDYADEDVDLGGERQCRCRQRQRCPRRHRLSLLIRSPERSFETPSGQPGGVLHFCRPAVASIAVLAAVLASDVILKRWPPRRRRLAPQLNARGIRSATEIRVSCRSAASALGSSTSATRMPPQTRGPELNGRK